MVAFYILIMRKPATGHYEMISRNTGTARTAEGQARGGRWGGGRVEDEKKGPPTNVAAPFGFILD